MIPAFLREPRGAVQVHNLSRRSFLKQVGLASGGLVLGLSACGKSDDRQATEPDAGHRADAATSQLPTAKSDAGQTRSAESQADFTELDTFVSIGSDGTVRVTVHRSEMGQGARTALAMLVADELGASWSDVKVTQAPGDMRYGDQNTDGSSTVRLNWEPLRKAGAAAREMLLSAAAKRLEVDVDALRAQDSAIVHEASGKRLRFAELAQEASQLEVPQSPKLRAAGERTIIGRGTGIIDGQDVVRGKAVYGIDVEVPDMLHASLERSPMLGGKIGSYDRAAALAVPGVRDVIELAGDGQYTNAAIAVVAEHTWAAMSGRSKLAAKWDTAGAALEQTEQHRAMLAERVMTEGKVALELGDMDGALSSAARMIDAQYSSPYLSHSPLEPLVAVADVREDRAEIWAPTQHPIGVRTAVAQLSMLAPEKITVHVTLLGGGFGRKSQPDFVLEAAAVSKAVGKPVKLTWTREDEIQHGFYRPESRQRLRATLDAKGAITGITGHSVFSTIAKAFRATAIDPLAGELQMGWTNPPFRLPNLRLSATGVPSGLRIGWWRSVCNTFHGFAWSSFIDELAAETKQDPVMLYKTLVGEPSKVSAGMSTYDTKRLLGVVDKVSAMGLWGRKLPKGEGLGFAAHMSFDSYVACVMHVAVSEDKKLELKQVDYAIDCGIVVNPDGVKAQCEGGLVFGLSAALYGEITVKDGAVVQSNFHDYPLLRLDKMPRVNVEIIESTQPPTGVGEPPTPVVAPALTNAIFAATGVRVRDLPLSARGYG